MLERKGIAYFSEGEAAYALAHVLPEFPEARLVASPKGYVVQTRKSGDYLGRNFRPSMENRLGRMYSTIK